MPRTAEETQSHINTIWEHLELELSGEPFQNPELEQKRQNYINWLFGELTLCN